MSNYLRAAKLLLGCYRTGDANDPDVYIAAVVRVLSDYPIDVAQRVSDPLTGLPSRLKWLPTVPEIREACEDIEGPRRRAREWDARSAEQLAERELLEQEPRQRQTREEFWAEMRERGFHGGPKDGPKYEPIESIKKRFGISDEQWNAIPNARR